MDSTIGRSASSHKRTPVEQRSIFGQAPFICRLNARLEGDIFSSTIAQIAEATGWQRHTVCGAISGALKKKLGLTITSEKPEGGERVYRIVDAA